MHYLASQKKNSLSKHDAVRLLLPGDKKWRDQLSRKTEARLVWGRVFFFDINIHHIHSTVFFSPTLSFTLSSCFCNPAIASGDCNGATATDRQKCQPYGCPPGTASDTRLLSLAAEFSCARSSGSVRKKKKRGSWKGTKTFSTSILLRWRVWNTWLRKFWQVLLDTMAYFWGALQVLHHG